MLRMRCHVVDTLPAPGGQCSALYPEKPIYDIPGYPEIEAQTLIDRLAAQAAPFQPTYHLGQQVVRLEQFEGVGFALGTSAGVTIRAGATRLPASAW